MNTRLGRLGSSNLRKPSLTRKNDVLGALQPKNCVSELQIKLRLMKVNTGLHEMKTGKSGGILGSDDATSGGRGEYKYRIFNLVI